MKKIYRSWNYDYIEDALKECERNQEWNVISIYPTGWRQEVTVAYYYIEKEEE